MSGGNIRHWDIRLQRQSISVRTYSSLSYFSLIFVLTMGYASIIRKVPSHFLRYWRNTSRMASTDDSAVWVHKGATLSDKTVQKTFGLRHEDIIAAIREGKLQYRHNTLYGNPCLKLLREEVECLVNEKYGMG